jgi:hypothetical protein
MRCRIWKPARSCPVPHWYADAGPISLYCASRTLLSAKTRVFVDLVVDAFQRDSLAERFAGSLGQAAAAD